MADEKPKDDKPKGDAKPKVEEKPAEAPNFLREIAGMLFMLFVFMTLFGGILTSANNFVSGLNGKSFTMRYLLNSYTRPVASALRPLGSPVVAMEADVAVYTEPGGIRRGTQDQRAQGTITQGPVLIGGERYWYVDFAEDPDGWVKESDIALVDGTPSLITRILFSLYTIAWWMKYILWLLIVVFAGTIAYITYDLTRVRNNVRMKLNQVADETISIPLSTNKNWDKVIMHVESYNESEWRLAVIEADMMLAELLDTMNLQGDSIGDKLKGVEKSDFNTLDLAWEAHKVRNQIAHDPSFVLTQREARRVISLFEQVFKEFSFI